MDTSEAPQGLDRTALRSLLGLDVDGAFERSLGPIDGSEGIYEVLLSQIRSGRLNGKTLSAGKLAAAFGVHRNTVAKVLSRLGGAGYLRVRAGRAPVVVGPDAVFPKSQTEFLSHEAIASRSGLAIATRMLDVERVTLGSLDPEWQERVRDRLELEGDDKVVLRLARIRLVRGTATQQRWVPCIAEDAFFAAHRLPDYVYHDLEAGVVDSVAIYCQSHAIKAVTSSYEIDVSHLPLGFRDRWCRLATSGKRPSRTDLQAMGAEPFIRLETTTHTLGGAMELSVAYLRGGLFRITAGTLDVGLQTGALADMVPALAPLREVRRS